MKTTLKRVLSVILCMTMLCSMAALCASAEDAASAVGITSAPTIAVKRAEGETVYELEFRFAPDEAGVALPFTSFDPEKTITIRIDFAVGEASVMLATITAKPTAFDPQTGVLTASVYDFKGNAGMNLHRLVIKVDGSALRDEKLAAAFGIDMAQLEETIQDLETYINEFSGSALGYRYIVEMPKDLLTGEGVGSPVYTITTKEIEGQVVREETLKAPKSLATFLKVYGRATTKKWFGQKLAVKISDRFFEKMRSGGEDMIKAVLSLMPIAWPVIFSILDQNARIMRSSLMSLAGIKFGGIVRAVSILIKSSQKNA